MRRRPVTDPKRQGGGLLRGLRDTRALVIGYQAHPQILVEINACIEKAKILQQRVGELERPLKKLIQARDCGADDRDPMAEWIWNEARQALREEPGEGGGPDSPHAYIAHGNDSPRGCLSCGRSRHHPIHGTGSRKGGQHD